ncbi:MAG: SDR family NAD(P)-dependent oxidoreductase [Actinomycetes bacterium]
MTASLPLTFSGQAALVTGGAAGIGRSCVTLLASAGLRVIALDRDESVTAIPGVEGVVADIVDESSVAALLEQLTPHGLAYVVNCAGIHAPATFDDVDLNDFRRVLDINTLGALAVTRAATPWLRSTGFGSVVNITSLEAHRTIALMNPVAVPHYAASKAALESLTRSMAHALAPDSITVNAVAPGFVATSMTAGDHGGSLAPQALAHMLIKRYATPEEIASTVAFLLSDGAAFITATTVLIDGGFHSV